MWMPTQQEAVEMYARFLSARYGRTASASACKTARSLEQKGDQRGREVWNDVAEAVESSSAIKAELCGIRREEAAFRGGLFTFLRRARTSHRRSQLFARGFDGEPKAGP